MSKNIATDVTEELQSVKLLGEAILFTIRYNAEELFGNACEWYPVELYDEETGEYTPDEGWYQRMEGEFNQAISDMEALLRRLA